MPKPKEDVTEYEEDTIDEETEEEEDIDDEDVEDTKPKFKKERVEEQKEIVRQKAKGVWTIREVPTQTAEVFYNEKTQEALSPNQLLVWIANEIVEIRKSI